MKKIISLLLVLATMFVIVGCGSDPESEKAAPTVTAPDGTVVIKPGVDIKGVWVVTSTPDSVSFTSPSDYQDSAKVLDANIRANINGVFPKDGIIEIFENGVSSCNGISMDYKFVADNAVEFSAKGSGLIFKVSKDGDTLKLKCNEKYEVVLVRK